jgi:hypothetical protein
MNTAPEDAARIRDLAESLDCIAEPDLCLLAGITPTTAESWRKRGKGPAYALVGNAYLYPRAAVAEFVRANVRERAAVPSKAML